MIALQVGFLEEAGVALRAWNLESGEAYKRHLAALSLGRRTATASHPATGFSLKPFPSKIYVESGHPPVVAVDPWGKRLRLEKRGEYMMELAE